MSESSSSAVEFVAGCVAGIAGLLSGHPLDSVKTRAQSSSTPLGTAAAFRQIVQHEGVRGLYKGVTAPIAGVAAINASVFGVYGAIVRASPGGDDKEPSLTTVCLAGSGSGIVTAFLTTPIERLKILQQSSRSRRQPKITTLIAEQLRRNGTRGLYRGYTPTILRDLSYGPYFVAYEGVLRALRPPPSLDRRYHHSDLYQEAEEEIRISSVPHLLLAGAIAGIVGWGCTFPLDLVKTRMQGSEAFQAQSANASRQILPNPAQLSPQTQFIPLRALHSQPAPPRMPIPHPYQTMASTISHSYQQEGWRVFFKGLAPTLLRSVPVNMVTFLVFELCVAALR